MWLPRLCMLDIEIYSPHLLEYNFRYHLGKNASDGNLSDEQKKQLE